MRYGHICHLNKTILTVPQYEHALNCCGGGGDTIPLGTEHPDSRNEIKLTAKVFLATPTAEALQDAITHSKLSNSVIISLSYESIAVFYLLGIVFYLLDSCLLLGSCLLFIRELSFFFALSESLQRLI